MNYLIPVNYQLKRDNIKSGDLIAYKGQSLIGRLIRRWTASDYSHVGIAWVYAGRVFVIESKEFHGVRLIPLSSALFAWHIPTKLKWTATLEEAALKQVGVKYSYMDCVRVGLGLPPKQDNGWQCAEYACWLFAIAGFALPISLPTPGNVVDAVLKKTIS